MEAEEWQKARAPLQRLVELYPESTGPASAYSLLAAVHRKLEETEEERAVLEQLAARDGDAVDVYLRLMELAAAAKDRDALITNAERMLAVNPLIASPHRHLARAADEAGDPARAIQAYRALLLLDPVDPAELHYRLASLYHGTDDIRSARLHVLKALEEAPRYRAAHRLLLELVPRIEAARKLEQEARLLEATTQVKSSAGKDTTEKSPETTNGEKRF